MMVDEVTITDVAGYLKNGWSILTTHVTTEYREYYPNGDGAYSCPTQDIIVYIMIKDEDAV